MIITTLQMPIKHPMHIVVHFPVLDYSNNYCSWGTIRNHRRGGKNFSVDEFFLVQIVCMNFFSTWKLHTFFFSTALLLNYVKEMQSLITVSLQYCWRWQSLWSLDFREILVLRLLRKKWAIIKGIAPHASRDVFSLVKETQLHRVSWYHSLQLNAKAIDKTTLTINSTMQGHIKQQSIHSGTRWIPEGLRAVHQCTLQGLCLPAVSNLFNIVMVSKEILLKVCYSKIILYFFYIWNMVLLKRGGHQM